MRHTRNKLLALSAALATALALAPAAQGQVSSDQVKAAIAKGVARLKAQQSPTGAWPDSGGHKGGMTALAVLALLQAGVPQDDPALVSGLAAVKAIPNKATYVIALKCQCFAAAGGKQGQPYHEDLKTAAAALVQSQLDSGMWTYTNERNGRGDNSNTQFALLGLHEAANCGVKVPQEVWDKSAGHFENVQCADGGWDYQGRGKSYGSMTAAGIASLYICGQRLNVGGKKEFVNGAYPSCGKYKQNLVLAGGLSWMSDNFDAKQNPKKGGQWLYYYLYGMERVGMISGRRNFGPHDWYRDGAEVVVAKQGGDGGWGQLHDTALAVLFLAKGNRPVLIEKLQYKGEWNRNIHDVENFIGYVGDKLGKTPTWQTITLEPPLEDLRQASIMYITGHSFPAFTPQERQKLRRFVETGGTLLCEACCGSAEYAQGFKAFAAEVFPEYKLEKLPADHPVFGSYHKIEAKDTYDLHGIDVGCRTSVFFSPRALSALWEMQDYRDAQKEWSQDTLKLGLNIAAYATGRELLRDKLDRLELPAAAGEKRGESEVPRGAVRIARLVHDGEYDADVHAMVELAAMLRDKAKVDVVAMERPIKPTDEHLYDYPVLFITGHYSFKLKDDEIKALQDYLKRGGVIVGEACCGRAAFDKSFREMAAALYPDQKLAELPEDHAIYAGQAGVAIGELQYRKLLADELKARGTSRPPVESISVEGRTTILYSKYDFSCGLEGDNPYSCRGYIDADARKLAMNLFLYAISY